MTKAKKILTTDTVKKVRKKKTEAPKPPYTIPVDGRPTIFTQELADYICGELAEGKSLRSVLDKDGMPAQRTVFYWLRSNEEFLQQYTRAKDESADALADDIQEIGNRTLRGVYDPAAARVAIEAYKWTASKLKPKKYGDKLEVDSNVKHSLAEKTEDELNQLVQGYLKGVGGGKSS